MLPLLVATGLVALLTTSAVAARRKRQKVAAAAPPTDWYGVAPKYGWKAVYYHHVGPAAAPLLAETRSSGCGLHASGSE